MSSKLSFADLFDAHYPMVYRTALGLVGNRADAEDVAQDTFMAAQKALPSFRGDASPATWLYRIAVRTAGRFIARRNRNPVANVEMSPAPAAEEPQALLQAMQRLPLASRTVILLVCVEGRTHSEAADILGIPAGTVASRLHTARAQLEALLARARPQKRVLGEGS